MSDAKSRAGTAAPSDAPPELAKPLRVSDLMRSPVTPFSLPLSEGNLERIAEYLDVLSVRKVRFDGEITSDVDFGLRLKGQLGATVTLKCVVTLEQFNQRIDVEIRRVFTEDPEDDAVTGEVELAENFDDDIEILGTHIDIGSIALEELSLNLPAFPRAPDANLETVQFAPPGVRPLDDAASKPFAALAALKSKIKD